jgi:hypothetical protein
MSSSIHTVDNNRPLSVHKTQGTIFPACPAQKLSTQINVELMDSQEVFGRHADGITSQPPSDYLW